MTDVAVAGTAWAEWKERQPQAPQCLPRLNVSFAMAIVSAPKFRGCFPLRTLPTNLRFFLP